MHIAIYGDKENSLPPTMSIRANVQRPLPVCIASACKQQQQLQNDVCRRPHSVFILQATTQHIYILVYSTMILLCMATKRNENGVVAWPKNKMALGQLVWRGQWQSESSWTPSKLHDALAHAIHTLRQYYIYDFGRDRRM